MCHILVGTQKDRRDKGAGTEFVTSASGKMEAERLKVTKYLECSALTQEVIRDRILSLSLYTLLTHALLIIIK